MHVLVLLTYESVRLSLSDGFIGTLAPKMPTGLSWLILVFTLWLRGRGAWHSCRALTAVISLATKHFLCSIPVPIPESESRTESKSSSLHQSRSHWVALVAWSSLITQVLPSSESSQGGRGGKGGGCHDAIFTRCSQCLLLGVATARVILSFYILLCAQFASVAARVCVWQCVSVRDILQLFSLVLWSVLVCTD